MDMVWCRRGIEDGSEGGSEDDSLNLRLMLGGFNEILGTIDGWNQNIFLVILRIVVKDLTKDNVVKSD